MNKVSVIQVSCACCGSWEAESVIKTPDYELHIDSPFEVAKCADCGHIYTSVRPTYDTLYSKFYPDSYICYGQKGKSKVADFIDQKRILGQAKQRAGLVNKHTNQNEIVKLLEIGCATGDFLKECKRKFSWNVTGIEPNKKLCHELKEQEISVINSTIEEVDIPPDSFDVICLFNVLEHLWDAAYSLKRINRILRPGGLLIIEIPDFDSLARSLFGKYWFLYHLPRHLSHFTQDSITDLTAEIGFEKVNILKQFRPTVNVLSLQYAVYDKVRSNLIRTFCSTKNPLMIAGGVLFESLQNLWGNSNIITCVFRKDKTFFGNPQTLLNEKRL